MSNRIVLELTHGERNPRNSEGAFIELQGGRLLFIYTQYYDESWSDIAPARLMSIHSDDGGITWSGEPDVVLENEATWNTMSVSLLRLPDQRIALFYLRTNSFHDCRLYMRTSADEARTWGEPVLCTTAPGYFPVLNDRVVMLSSGRIVVPTAYHRPKRSEDATAWKSWDYRAITLFYYSDDSGATWEESRDWYGLPVRSRSGMQEPGVVELKDGRLYAWARTDTGRLWAMFSGDGGETWSPPEPTRLLAPNSPMSMKRMPDGNLLAVWNDRSRRWKLPKPVNPGGFVENSSWSRTPLAVAISANEGRSWTGRKLIEDDHRQGFCYAALHFTDDAVLMAYCYGGDGDGVLQNTRIRRITFDWLYKD